MALIEIFYDQPDNEKRTAQETINIITKQLQLACKGVAQAVSDLQTDTGIKDKTAQFWIDQALERSSKLIVERVTDGATRDPRLSSRSCPTDEKQKIRHTLKSQIQEETFNWLITQPKEIWDGIPEESRASYARIDRASLYSNCL